MERKVDGVSPASVSGGGGREMCASASASASNPNRDTEPVVNLFIIRIMRPLISKGKLTVEGPLRFLNETFLDK